MAMASRGQGGCGGSPYMVNGLTGTEDDAISYCLENPAKKKCSCYEKGSYLLRRH